MIKKLLKPMLRLLMGASVCGIVFFFFYTLKSAQTTFYTFIPEAGLEREFMLDNRLSVRLAVDQRHVGISGARADIRLRVADGEDMPYRLDVSYGPFFLTGSKRMALARWQVHSRRDLLAGEKSGWVHGYTGLDGSISLTSRVVAGRMTLPFGRGRIFLDDAKLALEKSAGNGNFSLSASADGGRLVMPHRHIRFNEAKIEASALPVEWDDLGGRQYTPLSFARGEFSVEQIDLRTRLDEKQFRQLTGEFDSKVFEDTLSLEVFGLVGSLPVFSPEDTGELEYSFLLSGVDRDRLADAMRRDAELTRAVSAPAYYSLPEPVAGYRGPPVTRYWPVDPQMQKRLLALVRGGVDVYSNLKLTQAESTAQVRFNTEFETLGEGNSMMGLRNWGELLRQTMADFSFFADSALAEWPPIARWVGELDRFDLIAEDKYGPSSSAFLRDGEVKVNGEVRSIEAYLGDQIEQPIPAVAALRRARLRAVSRHHIH